MAAASTVSTTGLPWRAPTATAVSWLLDRCTCLRDPGSKPPARIASTKRLAVLYHGTASRFVDAIRAGGLLPGSRNHVHLSSSRETAVAVGARHGKPVVLAVDAAAMQAHGHVFYVSANGVWLTQAVPAGFIAFP